MSLDLNLLARFWMRVNLNGPIPEYRPELGPCWLWKGQKNRQGYGYFAIRNKPKKLKAAHRFLYEAFNGPIPQGLLPDHLCRVMGCVRPDHIEPVTSQVNILRGIGASAVHAKKEACPRGHPYDEKRVVRGRAVGRVCSICRRKSQTRRRKIRQAKAKALKLNQWPRTCQEEQD